MVVISVGTPLAAKLYEINGNYTLAFQVGAIFCVVGSMILFCGILIPDVFRKVRRVTNNYSFNVYFNFNLLLI